MNKTSSVNRCRAKSESAQGNTSMEKNMNSSARGSLPKRKLLVAAVTAATALLMASPASAVSFEWGEVTANLDTTLSYGASWRISERDPDLVGKAQFNPTIFLAPNAAQRAAMGRFSVNGDDGNLNYDDGDLISHVAKITSELDMQWRNYGAFVRGTYFYDFENNDYELLSEVARDEFVGERGRLLDAYVYGDFEIGDQFATVRLGRQVVSWGESTFIQGGINIINPVDVSNLRVAGSQLKEAFLPIEMIYASSTLTENLSVEALYMFDFEQIDPDPAGTYFSTNDFGTPGGSYAMLNFGLVPQPVRNPDLFNEVCMQGNFAATDTGLPPQLVAVGCSAALPRAEDRYPSDSGQFGLATRWFLPNFNDTELGFYYINYHSRLPLISGTAVTNANPSSGRYFVEYPDDIDLFGISFNSTLFDTGWAVQGELSYRPNLPLQIDDVEVLFAGLSPLNAAIPQPALRFRSQLGDFAPGEEIRGWNEHEVSQLQFTFLRLFGPNNPFNAAEMVIIGEVGAQKVWDLPSPDVLRYNAPGTDTGGGFDITTGALRNPQTESVSFADDFSWGYRIAGRLDYNNAFGTPFTVSPRIAFNHDVHGTSPGPGGNFIEDRKSISVGLAFNYLQKWVVDFGYTDFFDGGRANELSDRDFFSASIQYSF